MNGRSRRDLRATVPLRSGRRSGGSRDLVASRCASKAFSGSPGGSVSKSSVYSGAPPSASADPPSRGVSRLRDRFRGRPRCLAALAGSRPSRPPPAVRRALGSVCARPGPRGTRRAAVPAGVGSESGGAGAARRAAHPRQRNRSSNGRATAPRGAGALIEVEWAGASSYCVSTARSDSIAARQRSISAACPAAGSTACLASVSRSRRSAACRRRSGSAGVASRSSVARSAS